MSFVEHGATAENRVPSAFYHVTARGNERESVLESTQQSLHLLVLFYKHAQSPALLSHRGTIYPEQHAQSQRLSSGGSPYYLYKTLENSLVWQAVLQIHERGGIVAGCSAGAMILGKGFPGFPRWQKGFALLPDVVIVPHFDEMGQCFVRGMHRLIRRGNIVLGIDGSTGLLVDGQLKTVSVGEL